MFMIVNTRKLKGKIREMGLTQKDVADTIGMSNSTLNRKLNTLGTSFLIGEVHQIAALLSLSSKDCIDIFFAQKSHLCDKEVFDENNSN